MLAFIQFLELLLDPHIGNTDSLLERFCLMHAQDLASMHLTPWDIDNGMGSYYRYLPDESVQKSTLVGVIRLPQWRTTKFGAYQTSSLALATFQRQRLEDPQFHPFDLTEWVGSITFDQRALEEFILLLKQRTYERFVRSLQS